MFETFQDRRNARIRLVKTFSVQKLRTEIECVTNSLPAIKAEMEVGLHPKHAVMETKDYITILKNELTEREKR